MNTRKLVAASLTTLMIVAGNAAAAEAQAPFPSSAREVGGHWTGKIGRDTTPGMDLAVFPSAAQEFSSLADAGFTPPKKAIQARSRDGDVFPSAGIEISGRAL